MVAGAIAKPKLGEFGSKTCVAGLTLFTVAARLRTYLYMTFGGSCGLPVES